MANMYIRCYYCIELSIPCFFFYCAFINLHNKYKYMNKIVMIYIINIILLLLNLTDYKKYNTSDK